MHTLVKLSFKYLAQHVFFTLFFGFFGCIVLLVSLECTFSMYDTSAVYYACNFNIFELENAQNLAEFRSWLSNFILANLGLLICLCTCLSSIAIIAHSIFGFTNILFDYVTDVRTRNVLLNSIIILYLCCALTILVA